VQQLQFPRSVMVGLTGQRMINSIEELAQVINEHNGSKSIYISNVSYPGHEKNTVDEANTVRISQVYFDLDSSKLENAIAEARILKDWLEENNLPYMLVFSGKKGFQILLELKPAVYSLDNKIKYEDGDDYTIKDFYKQFYRKLRRELKLRTMDMKCAEIKRIRRVWNTQHINNKTNEKTGTYCVPLTPHMLDSYGPDEVLHYATEPKTINAYWNTDKEFMTFDQLMEKFHVNPKDESIFFGDDDVTVVGNYNNRNNKSWPWVKMHLPWKCLHNEMCNSSSPSHGARFASAIWWRTQADEAPVITDKDGNNIKITYSPEWVENFYQTMQYDDVHKTEFRKKQINSIWRSTYKMPTCRWIWENGGREDPETGVMKRICVAEKCERFAEFLPDIARQRRDMK